MLKSIMLIIISILFYVESYSDVSVKYNSDGTYTASYSSDMLGWSRTYSPGGILLWGFSIDLSKNGSSGLPPRIGTYYWSIGEWIYNKEGNFNDSDNNELGIIVENNNLIIQSTLAHDQVIWITITDYSGKILEQYTTNPNIPKALTGQILNKKIIISADCNNNYETKKLFINGGK